MNAACQPLSALGRWPRSNRYVLLDTTRARGTAAAFAGKVPKQLFVGFEVGEDAELAPCEGPPPPPLRPRIHRQRLSAEPVR